MPQEIVFSDSAAGSLCLAMTFGKGVYRGGAFGIVLNSGEKPRRKEIRQAKKAAEEQARKAWETAVPLGGEREDVHCFSLGLSVGDIAGDCLGTGHQQALAALFCYPEGEDAARDMMERARRDMASLVQRAPGSGLRVWYSSQPDELCGLYWLMDRLEAAGYAGPVSLVRLPAAEAWEDRVVVEYAGWGDVGPEAWGRLAKEEQLLPEPVRHVLAVHWRELQRENSPLRAEINGRLRSVQADFYDDLIRREIAEQPTEFQEGAVIGRVLGKYRPGVGDGWLALRIGEMLRRGELEAVTRADRDAPQYHRILRKLF